MHKNGPIIRSLIDTDFYKFTLMQLVYHQFPQAHVEYHFMCRTEGVNLVPYMAEIEEEIEHYCSLRFTPEDLDVLSRQRYLKPNFVEFLELYQPRMKHIKVQRSDTESGAIDIVINGPWLFTVPFEVPVLSIINEVYFRNNVDTVEHMRKGKQILMQKLEKAQQNPEFGQFRFNDFGTRRRFSREWHEKVVDLMKGVMPIQFVGSSNILLANRYRLNTMGTMPHEFLQACQALGPKLRDAQTFAFETWADEYQGDLDIALTDVIGMDAFMRDFNLRFCKLFDGMRQDSGDPFKWADQAIAHYEEKNLDPRTKTLVFSDQLTFGKAMDIQSYVKGRAQPVFGIGTNLTNDVGVTPLDVVIKMTECNGEPVAKISDSPGKTMCRDASYVQYLNHVYSK